MMLMFARRGGNKRVLLLCAPSQITSLAQAAGNERDHQPHGRWLDVRMSAQEGLPTPADLSLCRVAPYDDADFQRAPAIPLLPTHAHDALGANQTQIVKARERQDQELLGRSPRKNCKNDLDDQT